MEVTLKPDSLLWSIIAHRNSLAINQYARVTRLSPAFRVRLWLRETSLYHPVVDIQPPVFDRLQHTAKTAIKTGGGEGQGTRRAYHPVADVQQGYGGQHEPPPWVHTVLHAVASLHARGREGKGNLGRGSGGGGGGGGLAVLYVRHDHWIMARPFEIDRDQVITQATPFAKRGLARLIDHLLASHTLFLRRVWLVWLVIDSIFQLLR